MKKISYLLQLLPSTPEFTWSGVLAFIYYIVRSIWFKEVVHSMFVIITGVLGAIAIHIARLLMQKYFPLKKNNDN